MLDSLVVRLTGTENYLKRMKCVSISLLPAHTNKHTCAYIESVFWFVFFFFSIGTQFNNWLSTWQVYKLLSIAIVCVKQTLKKCVDQQTSIYQDMRETTRIVVRLRCALPIVLSQLLKRMCWWGKSAIYKG